MDDKKQPENIPTNQRDKIKDATKSSQNLKKTIQGNYDANDLRYMSSLSEAILAKSPSASKAILWLIMLGVGWAIFWASQAEIDEITRTQGKVIPSNQVQIIQNLEGGIISEILIKEGDEVKENQPLLKIDNKGFTSSYGESRLRLDELKAKYVRLNAEANGEPFVYDEEKFKGMEKQLKFERSLYDSNQDQLSKNIQILKENLKQTRSELNELSGRIRQLKDTHSLMQKEVEIMEPLVKKGLVSEVEFLQTKRQASTAKGELTTARLSVPRIQSMISEAAKKISEAQLAFKNKAKEELNEVVAEIARVTENQTSLEDRVKRTLVRSPVHGTISRLMVNTVSGVIKPGMDLVEIVPLEDNLVAEVKVKPADVAFLRVGLKAMVKFTAYDFSIYGGLEGTVTHISADTITNEKGESFYHVRIKTDKNNLGTEAIPLKIMVGMVVSADILTGKKTVLDYILKPILKAKHNALSER